MPFFFAMFLADDKYMFEDIFQSYLKTCLHNFWRLVCVMFEGMLGYI